MAHRVRNQTEAAYARSDLFERRRTLMIGWAVYLYGEDRAPHGPRVQQRSAPSESAWEPVSRYLRSFEEESR